MVQGSLLVEVQDFQVAFFREFEADVVGPAGVNHHEVLLGALEEILAFAFEQFSVVLRKDVALFVQQVQDPVPLGLNGLGSQSIRSAAMP